jgi:hypothetical protein
MPVAATPNDPRERWQPARLIPTAGIKGQQEQERRASSALLAVMMAVPEFSAGLLKHCGAPKGRVSTFVEVQLLDKDGGKHIPDGVIVVERGKTRWQALVEIKTGTGELNTEQVTRYMDMAREHGFDAVLTISNVITAAPDQLPYTVDGRKLRSTPVRHLSWWTVITEAILQYRHRGVKDPDQAWILGELIAYLDHENSGASGFDDMGDKWTRIRDDAKHETLRPTDPDVRAVAERWMQFVDYIALGMSQELGREVVPVRAKRYGADERLAIIMRELGNDGHLTTTIRVPDAIAPLQVEANLRTRRVTTSVEVPAPKEGRPQTRINWMLKQLNQAPADLRIDVSFVGCKETTSLLAGQAVERPDLLLSPTDPKREPRSFTLALGGKMGQKRGKGPGSFVGETKHQILTFYRDIVQSLQAWTPKAPKLRDTPVERELPTAGDEGGGITFRQDEGRTVTPALVAGTEVASESVTPTVPSSDDEPDRAPEQVGA